MLPYSGCYILTENGDELSLGKHVVRSEVRIIVVVAARNLGEAGEGQLQEPGFGLELMMARCAPSNAQVRHASSQVRGVECSL
jgi:hypothetical protein